MKFFDANVYIGLSKKYIYRATTSVKELLTEFDKQKVERAIVWHISQYDLSPIDGNNLVTKIIKQEERLFGCWSILPPQTSEIFTEDFFLRMKKNRIFALRAFPDFHRFQLNKIVFGNFLDEVSKRKIPLLLSLEKGISWQGVYALMKEYPEITCILCDIGIWGADRQTWPLLENYKNLYLEASLLTLGFAQLEATVKKFGAERIVFGSNFPERYLESPILEVLHSNISKEDKEKIAYKNLEKIISEIKL